MIWPDTNIDKHNYRTFIGQMWPEPYWDTLRVIRAKDHHLEVKRHKGLRGSALTAISNQSAFNRDVGVQAHRLSKKVSILVLPQSKATLPKSSSVVSSACETWYAKLLDSCLWRILNVVAQSSRMRLGIEDCSSRVLGDLGISGIRDIHLYYHTYK